MSTQIPEKQRKRKQLHESCPASTSDQMDKSPLRPIVCLRTKDKDTMKKVEAKEDCFILEFDPDQEFNFSKQPSVSTNADLQLVAQKGQIACRDFPHPRHSCARFTFEKTAHDKHCDLCYCYLCDVPAPCEKWVGGTISHCDAIDDANWRAVRKSMRQAKTLPIKVPPRRHRRHECIKFPFGTTSHKNHCELCNCYVCEEPAPCGMWDQDPSYGHCHAFRHQYWGTERKHMKKIRKIISTTLGDISREYHQAESQR